MCISIEVIYFKGNIMIGNIIKKQRIFLEITQEELAEGICSAKYIYLIEKEERNPSAYVLNQLSEKLFIDLFEYYQYLEFENPVAVIEHRKNIDKYIQAGDLQKLKDESLIAARSEDFKQEPLIYDIMVIDYLHKGLLEGKTSKVINQLTSTFEKKELNIDPLTLINGYIVLSTCYQLEEKLDKAKEVLEIAYELIENKKEFPRYHTVIINVMISLISYYYNVNEYEELEKYSKILLNFQKEYNKYSQIYYPYFLLSFAHYKKNQLVQSKRYFMEAVHSTLLFKNKTDLKIIKNMLDLDELIDELAIDDYYVKSIYELLD